MYAHASAANNTAMCSAFPPWRPVLGGQLYERRWPIAGGQWCAARQQTASL